MSQTKLQEALLAEIESQLKYFIDSYDFGQSQPLKKMITYHMGWEHDQGSQGKRIRPLLTLLCTGAFNGPVRNALPAAAAVEFLHNFTLIHDDIEDNASIRHGRKTLWKKWGLAQAVNAGDALFSIAQLTMLNLSKTCNQGITLDAIQQLNRTCLHLTRGQYLDIAFESAQNIAVDNYMEMIEGKTAALIALSTYLGGLTAGKDQSYLDRLTNYGRNLGLAFQIQDDYLGIWGDPQKTGKSAASDLLARKKSLPILYGLEHSDEFQRIWKGDQISAENITKLSELLKSCGAQDYVNTQAEKFTEQAFSAISNLFPQENIHSKTLFQLTESLLQRKF
jgi:geranylgeranyl diphosphate synthase type I